MSKIVAFTLIFAIFLVLVNYLIFFWINRSRKWRYEDVVFEEKVRQAAFEEIQKTHALLTDSKEEYITGRAYKTETAAEMLKRLESK
jgi:hypothetical protein